MRGETEDKIITFKTYYDPMLAHIERTRLADSGIPCFIADENMIGINPLYNNALGGIKLKIFEDDLEKCQAILNVDESSPVDESLVVTDVADENKICPHCGSTDVRYGAAIKKRFNWLMMMFSALFMTYPITTRKAWHCFNCGKDFE